jgi:predicted RNA-binding protein (virulence factor B family)
MIHLGQMNNLRVARRVDFGVFLETDIGVEILLPARDVPQGCDVGDEIEVFVCYDSEDRLIATTQEPKAMVGEFAHLRVNAIEKPGAFLDWGLPKDLFLPFSEQTRDLKVGHHVVVFVYLDKSERISASMRLDRHILKTPIEYKAGQAVSLMIAQKTELGFKAIIDNSHWGMLYPNEVFQTLEIGDRPPGFIGKIRPDGKIDLRLNQPGHQATEPIAERILELLKENGGSLPITAGTPPEVIYEKFQISKKKFKIALGGLYKQRLIRIEDDGIYLV